MVLNEKNEILLVLRKDFRIWTLPGGGVEPNETWEQAAVRETLEETGYHVIIKRYVGEYWRPQLSRGQGDRMRVFVAEIQDDELCAHDQESTDVRWFPAISLPKRMFRFAPEHIRDALAELSSPVSKEQRLPIWLALFMQVALIIRNTRNRIFSTLTSKR